MLPVVVFIVFLLLIKEESFPQDLEVLMLLVMEIIQLLTDLKKLNSLNPLNLKIKSSLLQNVELVIQFY